MVKIKIEKYEANYEFYKKYGFGGKLKDQRDNSNPYRAARYVRKANAYRKIKRRERYLNTFKKERANYGSK